MSDTENKTNELSLLGLPTHIIEDIVFRLRCSIIEVEYITELRLVCRQFNEAALHCLIFQGSPTDFGRRHYMSCPQECYKSSCRFMRSYNLSYPKFYLQAKMFSVREVGPGLRQCYATMREALSIFEDDLEKCPSSFPIARSQLFSEGLFRCGSKNPIFNNRVSSTFCDAVLSSPDLTVRWFVSREPWKDYIRLRSARFWLKNLACYLGDGELLDWYSTHSGRFAQDPEETSLESGELLGTLALRGHNLLFQDVVLATAPQSTSLSHALATACCQGNTNIATYILDVVPGQETAALCNKALSKIPGSRRLTVSAHLIMGQLASRCVEIEDNMRLICYLLTIAELGTADALRILLHRHRHRRLWPLPGLESNSWLRRNPASFTPLWSACCNADLACVKVLLYEGYFTNTQNREDVKHLCHGCMWLAVRANSLTVYEELCRFLGEDMDISYLAVLSDGISHVVQKLEDQPGTLLVPPASSFDFSRPMGGNALQHACHLLRSKNVKFLLEHGLRLAVRRDKYYNSVWIEWRSRRAYEQEYQEIRALLEEYGQEPIEVCL